MNRQVELHDCYFFDCDECGREVLVRPELLTMKTILAHADMYAVDPEELDMIREVVEAEGGLLAEKPHFVTCPNCDTSFEVVED